MKRFPLTSILSEAFRQNINLFLLCLLLFIILFPLFMESNLGREAMITFMTIIMLSGLRALGTNRKEFRRLLAFATLSPLVIILSYHYKLPFNEIIGMILSLVFFSLTAVRLHSHVMSTERSNEERLVSALCVYILLGITWAQVYYIVETMFPGAFNIPAHEGFSTLGIAHKFHTLMYYSFLTMTTVGYGDITPVLPIARSLVVVEVITGLFYMAVLIGQLAGAYIALRRSDEES